jgi:CheY-like chemotaxis protein
MSELQTSGPEVLTSLSPASSSVALPLIILADANGESRLRRAQQLQSRGFRVAHARTAFETIVKACCHQPALVLIDASLGDRDVQDTIELLGTSPATEHIRILRLLPGRRLPSRLRLPPPR